VHICRFLHTFLSPFSKRSYRVCRVDRLGDRPRIDGMALVTHDSPTIRMTVSRGAFGVFCDRLGGSMATENSLPRFSSL
jgi:hypothetical protein